MLVRRRVEIKLPVELAVKYEYEGSKIGMSLSQYLTHILSNIESKQTKDQIDDIHKMIAAIHNDYFEKD